MELSRILNSQQELHEADLRIGKWTDEEERFAIELIHHFLAGSIAATPGISLRSFLAKKLRCAPMRISTQLSLDTLAGERIPKRLGQKRYFRMDTISHAERQRIAVKLRHLEIAFLIKEEVSIESSIFVETDASSSADEAASGEDSATAVRVGAWSKRKKSTPSLSSKLFFEASLTSPHEPHFEGKMAYEAIPKRLGSITFEPALNRTPQQYLRTQEKLARLRRACFAPAKGPGRSLVQALWPVGPVMTEAARARLKQTGSINPFFSAPGNLIMGLVERHLE